MAPIYISDYCFDLTEELNSLPWLTKRTARMEYFMSNVPRIYRYGRTDDNIEYTSEHFSDGVKELLVKLNIDFKTGYNVCFLNRYNNQHNHLGWHSDDFEGADQDHPIACISFGAEREIWWKPKEQKGVVPSEQRQLLGHCSLWIMPGGFQDNHLHKIPKHSQPCGRRYSLTFRRFIN